MTFDALALADLIERRRRDQSWKKIKQEIEEIL